MPIDPDTFEHNSIERGRYTPSFFKLRVQTLEDLGDLNRLNSVVFGTFFHEYVHFLQDTTTTYGLMNGLMTVERMKYSAEQVLNQSATKLFDLPVDYLKDPTTAVNQRLRNLYTGSTDVIGKMDIVSVWIEPADFRLPPPHDKVPPKFMIKVKVEDGQERTLAFGAICLIEGMAHIAQNRIAPGTAHPDQPYRTAELLAAHMYPPIGLNDLYVFALCDACLLTYNPAQAFHDVLKGMRDEAFAPGNYKDVYSFVFNHIQYDNDSLIQFFSKTIDSAIEQYGHYFTTKEFTNEVAWLIHVLSEARTIRTSTPWFLADMIAQGTANTPNFIALLETLGTPMLFNIDDKSWFNPPKSLSGLDIQIDRFAVINEIYDLFRLGARGCALKSYCKRSVHGDITNETCNTPWLRTHPSGMCGYEFLWKTWGLNGYAPRTPAVVA